jgi:hypothetical protein
MARCVLRDMSTEVGLDRRGNRARGRIGRAWRDDCLPLSLLLVGFAGHPMRPAAGLIGGLIGGADRRG